MPRQQAKTMNRIHRHTILALTHLRHALAQAEAAQRAYAARCLGEQRKQSEIQLDARRHIGVADLV